VELEGNKVLLRHSIIIAGESEGGGGGSVWIEPRRRRKEDDFRSPIAMASLEGLLKFRVAGPRL